jgi:hypothetical protein
MKQLDRLLFLQGNRCFFCQQPIPAGEESVEHLIATSNGGAKDDENCVACCKGVNAALGNLSYKAKLQVVLNQRGAFVCPSAAGHGQHVSQQSTPEDERIALVLADLHKRGSARPRRLATLTNTIASVFQKKLSDNELAALIGMLQSRGYVLVHDMKVTYSLPSTAT